MKSLSRIKKTKKYGMYRAFIAASFLINGIFSFVAPVLAEGTAGGQSISNTATATYEDPNNPNTPINSTSNTVTVTVAEVAGITVTASGITNQTNPGGQIAPGNQLVYTYTITNIGNDPTKFRIPNQATSNGPGTIAGTLPVDQNGQTPANGQLQYSTNGGTSWVNVTPGGIDSPSVPVGGTVLVRVPVTIAAAAQNGDVVSVTLGNTQGDAQNVLRIADGGDVYTVDNPDGAVAGEVPGAPVNGVREGSITQRATIGGGTNTVALATVLKVRTGYDAGNTSTLNDDLLTYGLSLRVESSDPTNRGFIPAALAGTSITVDGNPVTRILVSDALPANTTLNAVPTPPPGWRVVYSTDDPAVNPTRTANQVSWSTTAPASLSTVKRIGFINDPNTVTSVATGTTVTGFTVQIRTTNISGSTATVNNVAQVFGRTAGDPNSPLIVDNSGDQNPDNYNSTTGNITTTPDIGYYPVTGTNPVDTANNNQAAASITGALNQFTISTPSPYSVLNGPEGAPDATGPDGTTNTDFTNKSSFVPPNTTPGSTLDPQSVGFTNTIRNNGTLPSDIVVTPTAPSNPTDLPDNTKVTVSYQNQSAVYNYSGGTFTLTSGTPVKITGVAAGANATYGVEVDLPPGTRLSTDTDIQRGFPVRVTTTLVDGSNNPRLDASSQPISNITINRVYTGFLQLLKKSQILKGTGPDVQGSDGTLSIDPKKPSPGNIIQYVIEYKNISEPQSGTGNVILEADRLVITEDGTIGGANGNNWALDNDNNLQIDTSNIIGSAKDSGAANITFYNGSNTPGSDQTGTTATTDVTKYVNTVTGRVTPGVTRTFSFQRKVN
ncbi:beta strand repeat-containing protein [Aliinostoc sp. HNIBRCY26]|uniref:beta strand repeat-containing protein n=1 Tax=Aliinostoc sp. HNIBRCY26 TaxID=3418997 RepID=UPI003D061AAE